MERQASNERKVMVAERVIVHWTGKKEAFNREKRDSMLPVHPRAETVCVL